MVKKTSISGIVRGLPKGVEPTVTVSAPSECYPYTEQISYSYTQPDVTKPGYRTVTVQIEQDREAESGSQWGPFTLTITSPGCQGVSFVADSSAGFDILLKKYRTVSQLSDGTNIYWVKDIDAREILETKADSSAIPTAISDLTDDTSTTPIDKADTLTGLTASITELNYTDGVTSNIQTQLDGKADTDLSNLTSTASANFDGVWISGTYNIISSSTTLNAGADKSYSLSTYLPDDNYVYEVYFSITGTTGANSGNYVDIAISSTFLPSTNRVAGAQTRTASSVMWTGSGTAPIGTNRTINVRNFGNNCTVNQFRVFAYRRIGTNQ